jgi:hypothetical protein
LKRSQSIQRTWWDETTNKWTSKRWTTQSAWKVLQNPAYQYNRDRKKSQKKGKEKKQGGKAERTRKEKKKDRGNSIANLVIRTIKQTPSRKKKEWSLITVGTAPSRKSIVYQLKTAKIYITGRADQTKQAHGGV